MSWKGGQVEGGEDRGCVGPMPVDGTNDGVESGWDSGDDLVP